MIEGLDRRLARDGRALIGLGCRLRHERHGGNPLRSSTPGWRGTPETATGNANAAGAYATVHGPQFWCFLRFFSLSAHTKPVIVAICKRASLVEQRSLQFANNRRR